jgi:predicted transposase/invertase (TIGR01784 family)
MKEQTTPTTKKLYNDRDELHAAEARGREEGIEIGEARGENKKAIEIARNLLSQNIDIDIISSTTGLSAEEIAKLKQ